MQFFFFKNNDFSRYLNYKSCKYPTFFFCFSAVDYIPSCISMSSSILHTVIVHTYTKWLVQAREGVSLKHYPLSINFKYKIWLSSSKFEVSVL